VDDEAIVAIYAAEFIHRKNHRLVVDAIALLRSEIPNLVVVLAGKGILEDSVKQAIRRAGLEGYVRAVGFVTAVEELYQLADVAISSSRQEGLGLNLIEGMMCGCPVVATVDRGHCTVVTDGVEGLLVPQGSVKAFADALRVVLRDVSRRASFVPAALEKASQFELAKAVRVVGGVYLAHLPSADQSEIQ